MQLLLNLLELIQKVYPEKTLPNSGKHSAMYCMSFNKEALLWWTWSLKRQEENPAILPCFAVPARWPSSSWKCDRSMPWVFGQWKCLFHRALLCFELFTVALELVSLDISRWLCLETFFPHKASTIFVQEQRRQKYFEETLYADDKIKSSQMSLVSHSSTRRFRSLWCSGEAVRALSHPVLP